MSNPGLVGAKLIASEKVSSVSSVKIRSDSTKIVMGNVVPLKEQIKKLQKRVFSLERKLSMSRYP